MELAVYAVGGQRGFILFPKGQGGWSWNRVVAELCEVLAFFEAASGSHLAGVLSSTEKKIGKKLLKDSLSGRSGGAWPIVGGVLSLFAEEEWSETIRPVKMWVPLLEMCDLDFLPAVRSEDSKDMRLALDCFVLEKFPLGPMVKATPLCPLGKKLPDRGLFD